MTKNFKLVLALVLSIMMVLGSMSALAVVAAGTYTIEVTNSNNNVSIANKTYKAYKLFDVTYQNPADNPNTEYGNDDAPHSYTLSTDSVFYTTAAAKTEIEKYFTLTAIEGDTSKVVVTPIMKDAAGKLPTDDGYDKNTAASIFDVTAAYALSQALLPYLPTTANAEGTASGETVTIDVSNKGDAGYYLVTGEGFAKNADGTVNTEKTVTAAVAVTTTDPKAKIVAKVDAPSIDKKIDEQGVNGNPGTYTGKENKKYDIEGTEIKDLTEDNHSIGDTVPYVVKSKVPNMTGYEKYFFIVNDTMSKGLTFNADSLVIKFVDSTGAVKKTLEKGTDYTLTTTGGNGADTEIEIVFKNFIQYKGTEVTADNLATLTGSNDKALIGTYWGSFEDCDIIITYNATLNEHAVIGDLGNPNTLYLTYSRKPDVKDNGTPENPDKPSNPDVVGETPESTTKTYTTGLKVLKYTGADKKPLADAKFELTGKNLNVLKETSTEYFRAATEDETATHYLLKDGNYTTTAPVTDDDASTTDIDERTIDSYVKTWDGDTPAAGYIKDTMKSWTTEGTTPAVKVTATTDSEGLLTFTGLACGDYVLEETEAPAGYNKLDKKLYINVSAGTTEDGTSLTDHAFVIKYKLGEDGEQKTLSSTEAAANLFELEVENNAGVELPSTGGIGTTIFYVAGSIMVLAAAILLITKRRMGAND